MSRMRVKRDKRDKDKLVTVKFKPEEGEVIDRVQRAVLRDGWASFGTDRLDAPTKAVVIVEALLQMERRQLLG